MKNHPSLSFSGPILMYFPFPFSLASRILLFWLHCGPWDAGIGDWEGGGGGSLFHFPFSVPHFPMWGPIFGRFVETVKTECLENSMLLPIFRASGFRLQASFCENFILNLMSGCLPLPTYASPELLHHPRAPVVLLNPRHSRRSLAALSRIVEL